MYRVLRKGDSNKKRYGMKDEQAAQRVKDRVNDNIQGVLFLDLAYTFRHLYGVQFYQSVHVSNLGRMHSPSVLWVVAQWDRGSSHIAAYGSDG